MRAQFYFFCEVPTISVELSVYTYDSFPKGNAHGAFFTKNEII